MTLDDDFSDPDDFSDSDDFSDRNGLFGDLTAGLKTPGFTNNSPSNSSINLQ